MVPIGHDATSRRRRGSPCAVGAAAGMPGALSLLAADRKGFTSFDAQLVAVCREHGVSTILTEDRDFSRFGLRLDS